MQLRDLLSSYRQAARSGREKGDCFERVVRVFLETTVHKSNTNLQWCLSLALMSQTVREWQNNRQHEFTASSACSDTKSGVTPMLTAKA